MGVYNVIPTRGIYPPWRFAAPRCGRLLADDNAVSAEQQWRRPEDDGMTMTGSDWLVILAGLASIMWVNWYFFVAGRAPAPAAGGATASASQEQLITVDGGYSPAVISVKAGRPVRLVFDRQDTGSCSEEVVLPDFGMRRFLPTGQKTVVEVTPPKAGRYDFTCGMSMLRGALDRRGLSDTGRMRS